jgi:hypothetical protein
LPSSLSSEACHHGIVDVERRLHMSNHTLSMAIWQVYPYVWSWQYYSFLFIRSNADATSRDSSLGGRTYALRE